MSVSIDPRAVVSPRAHLGTSVSVGPFAIVEEGAVIGDGSTVAAQAYIASGARIGRNCHIHHSAVVGHAPQDLKYAGELTTCEVGDRTVVREFATLHRGTGEGGRTVIGEDGFFMAYSHVAHDCIVGDNVILSNAAMLAGHCSIGDWVIIGGITPVHQFVNIGKHAMIGGGLRVPKDIPPFVLAGGEPVVFEGLNSIGLRRRGFTPEVIDALDRTYTLIYRSGLNVTQAVDRIKDDAGLFAIGEVRDVLDFIAGSKRGIIRAHRTKG
jgi:UDP-N-acetylglucosamine acyltransferase